jgi:hypothetical protein
MKHKRHMLFSECLFKCHNFTTRLASNLTIHIEGFACYANAYLNRVFFAFALKICIKYKIN